MDEALLRLLDYHRLCCLMPNGWLVRFRIFEVHVSAARPAGIRYSFTLHDRGMERLLGFDNAHGVPRKIAYDHQHRFRRRGHPIPYLYQGADVLLVDFFAAVEQACRQEDVAFEFVDEWYEPCGLEEYPNENHADG